MRLGRILVSAYLMAGVPMLRKKSDIAWYGKRTSYYVKMMLDDWMDSSSSSEVDIYAIGSKHLSVIRGYSFRGYSRALNESISETISLNMDESLSDHDDPMYAGIGRYVDDTIGKTDSCTHSIDTSVHDEIYTNEKANMDSQIALNDSIEMDSHLETDLSIDIEDRLEHTQTTASQISTSAEDLLGHFTSSTMLKNVPLIEVSDMDESSTPSIHIDAIDTQDIQEDMEHELSQEIVDTHSLGEINESNLEIENHDVSDTNESIGKSISNLYEDLTQNQDTNLTKSLSVRYSQKLHRTEALGISIESLLKDELEIQSKHDETMDIILGLFQDLHIPIDFDEAIKIVRCPLVTSIDDLVEILPNIRYTIGNSTLVNDSYWIKHPWDILLQKSAVCLDVGIMIHHYLRSLNLDSRLIYWSQVRQKRVVNEHSWVLLKYDNSVRRIDPYHHRHILFGETDVLYRTPYNYYRGFPSILKEEMESIWKKLKKIHISRRHIFGSIDLEGYDLSDIHEELHGCLASQYRTHIFKNLTPFYVGAL